MITSGKAKTASKNNSGQRKKPKQKMYKDKLVKPVRYIDRDSHANYMSAQYDNGSLVENDVTGTPIKWDII